MDIFYVDRLEPITSLVKQHEVGAVTTRCNQRDQLVNVDTQRDRN